MTERLIETGGLQPWSPPRPSDTDAGVCAAMLEALTGNDFGPIVLISGEPPAWQRARATIRNGKIATFTDTKTRKAAERLSWQLKPLGKHPSGPLAVVILFYRSSARRVDIDNLQKAVLDAATKAGVWQDDSQVAAIASIRRVDRVNPRIVCALAAIPTSQLEIPA